MSNFSKALVTILVLSTIAGLIFDAGAQESGSGPSSTPGENGLAAASRTQLEEIRTRMDELSELREQREQAEGEERLILQRRSVREGVETLGIVGQFVDNVVEMEEQGLDSSEFRPSAEQLLTQLAGMAHGRIEELRTELSELRSQRDSVAGEDLLKLVAQLADANETLNLVLEVTLDNADRMEKLGMSADEEREYVAGILEDRAAIAGERVTLSLEQISGLKQRLEEKPDDPDLTAELAAAEAKRDTNQENLTATIEMMNRLDLETTEYQKLLIQATGQITTDILDTKVAVGLFGQWLAGLRDWAVDNGPRVIFKAFLFLLIFLLATLLFLFFGLVSALFLFFFGLLALRFLFL